MDKASKPLRTVFHELAVDRARRRRLATRLGPEAFGHAPQGGPMTDRISAERFDELAQSFEDGAKARRSATGQLEQMIAAAFREAAANKRERHTLLMKIRGEVKTAAIPPVAGGSFAHGYEHAIQDFVALLDHAMGVKHG